MHQFHPIIQHWFKERYGQPTDIQDIAWPAIQSGDHLLITAPTGSGKTLTAFLWSLNQFITGELATGQTSVLYVSPLKALNNDIRENLLEPLDELKKLFEAENESFPDISVATRSGDTSQDERRRMQKKPPEILITTPESLNLMLSSMGGLHLLGDIRTLILDEIHAVADSKRGVYLMSAVERVAGLSGEFQRIALSATVNPIEDVAELVAGYEYRNNKHSKREIKPLRAADNKQYEISIRYPESAAHRGEDEKIWDYLAEDMLPRIEENTSTLVFVNSRAVCEKLTYKLNAAAGRLVAYAHHGSLAREIRTDVEHRLRDGKLEAIVATSTLEMGIDIGALDEVILVQSPGSIASTIQRIGRAGHQVGAASRCTIYPTHPQDFLEAAVLAKSVQERALEPVRLISKPLDVLSQIIISMTATRSWDLDELLQAIRCSTPYHRLTPKEFDLVISMLTGRYEDRHIRELKPRVRVDRLHNTIEAKKGAVLSLYLSGGVIPDRGYFQLRHESDNARIGELDEEFVWEARIGQVFALGTQNWQVRKITHSDVLVKPASPDISAPPFWRSESISKSFHYASRIGSFLEHADQHLNDPAFQTELGSLYRAEDGVVSEIIDYLKRQKAHTGTALPHRHHLLIEHANAGPGGHSGYQLILHTGWGAAVNRPFGLALEASVQKVFGGQPEVFVSNESVVVQLPERIGISNLFDMVSIDQIEPLLRQQLEGSGYFGARFRENAGRSLLLSKGRFNERKPLWMSRLQSQKLMESVLSYEDFPILLETWRTCLQDEFDMDSLALVLEEISTGEIRVSEVETSTPSPFARSVTSDQINTYMYMTDDPKSGKSSRLSQDLLQEVVFSSHLRPAISIDVIRSFESGRQRLNREFAIEDDTDLLEWTKERSMIPESEWSLLLNALNFEPDLTSVTVLEHFQVTVALEDEERFSATLTDPQEDTQFFETLIANWLQFYGPLSIDTINKKLNLPREVLQPVLTSLVESGIVIDGQLILDDDQLCYCDAANFDHLLRLQRAQNRPDIHAKPAESIAAFLFQWQTRFSGSQPEDRLFECLETLKGLPLSPGLWESDVLPARLPGYDCRSLDILIQEGEIQWCGTKDKKVAFTYLDDIDLIADDSRPSRIIADDHARYDFGGLIDKTGSTASDLTDSLWDEVWQGSITNDSAESLRRGVLNGFGHNEVSPQRSRRGSFSRWKAASPWTGNWFRLPDIDRDLDPIESQEQEKNRARVMLARNGIVFRELIQREPDTYIWRNIFRALRLMELSGEVVSGHFFEGITGPQYMTPAAVRAFQQQDMTRIFYICASDPASPSGLGLGAHGKQLPRRLPGNYLVYHGDKLVMTVSKRGSILNFYEPADCEYLDQYLDVLRHLLSRSFQPLKKISIEEINSESPLISPYRDCIQRCFNTHTDHKQLVLEREP